MSDDFTIGQVLTVLTGRLLCSMDECYRVLNFLTGESLYTHQLPRAMRVCEPHVAAQYPEMAVLDWSNVGPSNYRAWLDKQSRKFGKRLPLSPLPDGAYEAMDPIDELVEMRERAR